MIKTVLFDLDGTLLPMDLDLFTKSYFGSIAKRMASYGYEPNKLIEAIWAGTKSMVINDGTKNNEEVFWLTFTKYLGGSKEDYIIYFDEFYELDFANLKSVCGYNPDSKKVINEVKRHGLNIILATNPIFPNVVTSQRIKWSGLDTSDFMLYTTYENSYHCKPNLEYYNDIIRKFDLNPKECLMVGNDVGEDMVTSKLGMKVFLLTDCLINKNNIDINQYPNGDLNDLLNYINTLL